MNHTPDATAAENSGDFDPQRAAALLDQSTLRARRTFQPSSPLLIGFRAVVVLGAFGGVWLSVRGQHPYTGPAGWATGIAYALVGIVIGWSSMAMKRAADGVSGPAQRSKNLGIAVMLAAWVAVFLFMAALAHAVASHAIVFGLYPATAPLMIVGLVAAANGAGREDWPLAGSSLAIAVVATAAAFGGPVGAWLIMAVGLCAVFLGYAAFTAWQQRRSAVRA